MVLKSVLAKWRASLASSAVDCTPSFCATIWRRLAVVVCRADCNCATASGCCMNAMLRRTETASCMTSQMKCHWRPLGDEVIGLLGDEAIGLLGERVVVKWAKMAPRTPLDSDSGWISPPRRKVSSWALEQRYWVSGIGCRESDKV